ncbi:MAG: hypothetical protein AAF653_19140, partial [Chloroflexota bacterium]
MQIHTEKLSAPSRDVHKVLYAAVTPRPIAWVSTVDEGGLCKTDYSLRGRPQDRVRDSASTP